jgi:translocation and assembly module TamA
MRLKLILLVMVCLGVRAAMAADPQPYAVKFDPTGNKELDSTLKASSQLESLRTSAPAGPFALIGRAQSDIERLQTVLESFGFYQRQVNVTIAGRALEDSTLPTLLLAAAKSPAVAVQVKIQTGPLYHLRKVTLQGDVSDKARSAFALQSGAPAIAAQVLAAGQRLQDAMQEEGHAFAKVEEPTAFEDAHEPVLDVTYTASAGAIYQLGEIRVQGLQRMHKDFVEKRLMVHPGDLYSPSKIEHARTDLLSLGVFSGVTVQLPKQEEVQDGRVPITFQVSERKRHGVSLSAAYSTDLGGSAGATWTDRDAFGNAEQLAVTANLINAGGSATTQVGYQLGAQLTKPDFLRNDQSLQYSVGLLKQDLEAYDQDALTAGIAVNRTLSSRWKASIGVTVEQEKITQVLGVPNPPNPNDPNAPITYTATPFGNNYTLLGVPITLKYDSTGLSNPLDDPLHGVRVSGSITPTESFNSTANNGCALLVNRETASASASAGCPSGETRTPHATFLILQGSFATYLDLHRFGWTPEGRSVLAFRALGARAIGASQFALPPDQRFYGGGSATVRGYAYQSIGPLIPNTTTPAGGVELAAVGVEFRQRLYTNFAAAVFVDAGAVTEKSGLFEGSFHEQKDDEGAGTGVGLRYYTPIGPVRLDVGFPIQKLPNSGSVQVYVGLGQAF